MYSSRNKFFEAYRINRFLFLFLSVLFIAGGEVLMIYGMRNFNDPGKTNLIIKALFVGGGFALPWLLTTTIYGRATDPIRRYALLNGFLASLHQLALLFGFFLFALPVLVVIGNKLPSSLQLMVKIAQYACLGAPIYNFILAFFYFFLYKHILIGYKQYLYVRKQVNKLHDEKLFDDFFMHTNEGDYKKINKAIEDYPTYIANRKIEESKALKSSETIMEYNGESAFDGSLGGWIIYKALYLLLTIATLGILESVGQYLYTRWEVNHTVISGRRLHFEGTIKQIFWKMIIWNFLAIITFGLFALSIPIRIKRWQIRNTSIVGGKSVPSEFTSKGIKYIGMVLLTTFINVITFGLLEPFARAMMMKHIVRHSVYNGYHLTFKGSPALFFGKYILWWLLGFVTFGIFPAIFVPIRILRWLTKNTMLEAFDK